MRRLFLSSLLLLSLPACAQQTPFRDAADPGFGDGQPAAIAVGKGSYAAFPPPEVATDLKTHLAKAMPGQLYISPDAKDLPVPTNHWWTNMIFSQYMGQMWALPQCVKASAQGLEITYPVKWRDGGNDMENDNPIKVTCGDDFQPVDSRAEKWSDWLVTSRLYQSDDKYWDVTMGKGLPYVWIEPKGTVPLITVQDDAKIFNAAGADADLTAANGYFGLEFAGRDFGVFAPSGTRFTGQGNVITPQFPVGKPFLIIAMLPARTDLALFQKYCYAVPRDSRLTWDYSPAAGTVTTHWHLDTEPLQGTEKRLLQGWLPHHYRTTQNDLQFAGPTYECSRGLIKCALGTDFNLTYTFNGIPPVIPAPVKLNATNDYDVARMHSYVQQYATRTTYGDDTYWGGKSLIQLGQYMLIAKEIGDPAYATLHDTLKTALTDWYTYTPGEKAHFFAAYPKYKALIGFNTSYGSEAFNDQHFHYGYFTTATAMLGLCDPQFLKDYGPMATLVAKEYANWDRKDPNFPFLRTFDCWEGHSWAGGTSGATGDNQESSSEAAQSWGGLFLLGNALRDKQMTAAGAMGYTMETRAIQEYWFNRYGDNYPPQWPHPITGIVWSAGKQYATYFSGDPAWIWSIQWLPMSPIMGYLVEDPAFAKKDFKDMWIAEKADLAKRNKGDIDVDQFGTGLGNVILSQAAQVNPDWAIDQFNKLWDAGSAVAHDNDTPGLTYYLAESNRNLGLIQWQYHTTEPLSRIYRNDTTGTTFYTAWNNGDGPETVTVYEGAKVLGHFAAKPGELTVVTGLEK